MTRITWIGGVLLSALALGACAADGSAKKSPDSDLEDDKSASPSKSSPSSPSNNDDDGHYTLPATPAAPATPEPTTPANEPSAPADPAAQPTGTPQTLTCTATNGSNKSVTTFELTVDNANGTVLISKMTVAIVNKDARNKNDVDVFLTPQGGSETKAFNSGDILPNAKTTEVPLAATFKPKTGTKVRIETNFDQAFSDPSASCTIQL